MNISERGEEWPGILSGIFFLFFKILSFVSFSFIFVLNIDCCT